MGYPDPPNNCGSGLLYKKIAFYILQTKSSKSQVSPTSTQALFTSLSSIFSLLFLDSGVTCATRWFPIALLVMKNPDHNHPNNEKSPCCREHFPVAETAAMPVISITMHHDSRPSVWPCANPSPSWDLGCFNDHIHQLTISARQRKFY